MNPRSTPPSEASANLPFEAREIAERKAFLEFTRQDCDRLRHLHDLLDPSGPTFTNAFYKHLLSFAAMRRLIPDQTSLDGLRAAQSEYFSGLTAGDYGDAYVANRLRVGQVHQQIGLEPKWYIGAYRKYLSGLMPLVWEQCDGDSDRFLASYDSLLKIVLFDMGLALDSYFQAERRVLQETKDYADRIIATMPNGLLVLDAGLRLRTINLAGRKILGLREEDPVLGQALGTLVDSPALHSLVQEVLADQASTRSLMVGPLPELGGRILAVTLSATLIEKAPALIIQLQDETERVRSGERLARFRTALDASDDTIFLIDRASMRFLDFNEAATKRMGYTREELLEMGPHDIKPLMTRDELAQRFDRILADPEHIGRLETLHRRRDGSTFPVELTLHGFLSEGRQMLVGVGRDISQRKQAEEELLHMATHDALTGLPNRSLLQDRIGQAIGQADRMRRELAVLFIDIDRFKNINDSLGHTTGDRLIITLAHRLRSAVRQVDTVARVGGDEFVVVLTEVTRESDILQIIANLLDAITQPVPVDDHELSVTASIGISLYPRDGKDVTSLLKNADTAMYRAKDAGRNGFRFYMQEMNADALGRLRLENDLRNAIKGDELMMHYQPQVDAETGRIVAAEALLRWRHPRQGMISPGEFIPLAEETGLIVPIGEWVLRRVCAQMRAWHEAELPHVNVAVNLSPRQFRQPNIVEMIAAAVHDSGLQPEWLELEITEGSLMHNPEEAATLLAELSQQGYRLSVDDFGTGYSSLAYLKRFPLHALKIDRSFVGDIESNRDSAAIAAAVIALAHSLGLKVVAEGVEKDVQMDYLRGLKCDFAQGYLYGRPMPAEEFMALMQRQPCPASIPSQAIPS